MGKLQHCEVVEPLTNTQAYGVAVVPLPLVPRACPEHPKKTRHFGRAKRGIGGKNYRYVRLTYPATKPCHRPLAWSVQLRKNAGSFLGQKLVRDAGLLRYYSAIIKKYLGTLGNSFKAVPRAHLPQHDPLLCSRYLLLKFEKIDADVA